MRRSRVGAIGMCLTGGFALAMAVDPGAGPGGQPTRAADPLTVAKRAAVGLDLSPIWLRSRPAPAVGCAWGCGFPPIGAARPSGSPPWAASWAAPSKLSRSTPPGNPHAIPTRAHAVLTVDLVDEAGHPTRAALDRVLGFLDQRLHP